MSAGFPVDLILFAMVAAFLVLRLRSILGRRTGYERPPAPLEPDAAAPAPRPIDARPVEVGSEQRPAPPARLSFPDDASAAGQALQRIRAVDPSFDPPQFLGGAEQAFRLIVGAFAAGDRATLQGLLAPDVFGDFESAISTRDQAQDSQRTEILSVTEAGLVEADLKGTVATIGVRFVSEQINQTLDRAGATISGGVAPAAVTDVWSFTRDLGSSDPTWLLVGTRSEE